MADENATDAEFARAHGTSVAAIQALRQALQRGGFRQAQFSHPDLGGMGQWSAGGMTQVGDMFNDALRRKVDAICTALARHHAGQPAGAQASPAFGGDWWPGDLGRPSAAGAQNGMRYACFPQARRVVVEQGGRIAIHDSGDHRISGVSQSQSGTQDLCFTSQLGTIRASDLPVVGG
jgi:hypothetical protein